MNGGVLHLAHRPCRLFKYISINLSHCCRFRMREVCGRTEDMVLIVNNPPSYIDLFHFSHICCHRLVFGSTMIMGDNVYLPTAISLYDYLNFKPLNLRTITQLGLLLHLSALDVATLSMDVENSAMYYFITHIHTTHENVIIYFFLWTSIAITVTISH